MKNHKSVFMGICCYILLNFVIGVSGNAVADTKAPPTSTGVTAPPPLYKTIEGAKTYIVQHQNRDGGWPLVTGGESNVENTAFAIWALIDAGWGTGSQVIRMGVAYLRNTQADDGSWNNNTAHTVFALIALTAAETDPEVRFKGLRWLKKVQNRSGSWGKMERSPDNVLYTAAVLAGFRRLGFKQSFEPVSKGADWLAKAINFDGGWAMQRGMQSDVFLTSWVIQGLEPVYDIDAQIAWLKQLQNKDGGFGRYKNSPSDAEITAIAVLALAAGNDPLNTRRVAIDYLTSIRQKDGSFVSNTPMELTEPTANLQSTCFVLIAIHAKTPDEFAIERQAK
jgi:prenyltransferase beta subunit